MGLALALIYILSCTYSLLPVTASPLTVPDDAVWTSPSEAFFVGQSGASLKCSFQENPIAVYWLKGESLQTAVPIITWYKEEITTQNEGFEFGPNFSLLFEHPGISDTGRYHCRVSNHQGILSSNHTDLTVLDGAVWTSPSETFLAGQSDASLKCLFEGNPIAVYWLKGESLQTAMTIITWYRGEIATENEGFEFGPDFSLIFEHPGISDTGRYYCRVSNHQGILSSNHVDLTVLVRELDQVQVTQCAGDPFNQDSPCIIKVHPDQDILELDCIVEGARQPVLLTWHNAGALHISLNTTSSSEKILEDGTYLKKISLRLHTEEMESGRKILICLAQGLNATRTVNVTIQFEPEIQGEGPSTVGIVVGVIFILAVINSALVVFIIWKRFIRVARENEDQEENHEGEESQERQKLLEQSTKRMNMMNEKRERVFAYRPQNKTTPTSGKIEEPPPVHLGVFGLSRAGKSAFINSLYFALKGEYSPIADETNEEKQRTEWREAKTLTPYIKIFDNKGLKNYNTNAIPELMQEIRGIRGEVPNRVVQNGDTVDCPILICNFSDGNRDDEAAMFISDFSNKVHTLLGRRLVLVLTHKDEMVKDDDGMDNMRNWLVNECDIPASHVWIFENYTMANHEENVVKTNEFLDFLLKCVELAERNVNFRHMNETQTPPQTSEWKCIIS